MLQKAIEEAVHGRFPQARVGVQDLTGTGDHFEVTVVAPDFEGKSSLERHRMVYGAIWPTLGNQIHALAIKAFTPGEAGKGDN